MKYPAGFPAELRRKRGSLILVQPSSDGTSLGAVRKDYDCPVCGEAHEVLYAVRRVLADQMGHFPVFRFNGEMHPVDGTLPHTLRYVPRDAVKLTKRQAHTYWKSTSHSVNPWEVFASAE
jgi:hypothetical protein